jgi:hypothetical protein
LAIRNGLDRSYPDMLPSQPAFPNATELYNRDLLTRRVREEEAQKERQERWNDIKDKITRYLQIKFSLVTFTFPVKIGLRERLYDTPNFVSPYPTPEELYDAVCEVLKPYESDLHEFVVKKFNPFRCGCNDLYHEHDGCVSISIQARAEQPTSKRTKQEEESTTDNRTL